MAASYKEVKEAFVSDMTGSTVTHINLISCAALASIALYFAVQTRFQPFAAKKLFGWAHFSLETALLVIPLLLSMTLSADAPLILSLSSFAPSFILFALPQKPTSVLNPLSRPSSPRLQPASQAPPSTAPISISPLPSVTVYRSHMLLMTVLAILAVDFPVFPRNLAKCESWGVSLMDLGVGSFVFSNGLISAIPLLKNPFHLYSPMLPKMLSACKKSVPLFLLGLLRVVLVKGAEYPEHMSEYGVHWNFFFTLAFIPPFAVLLHPVIATVPIPLVGLLLTGGHQLVLSTTSLQAWALGEERVGLLGQNKEGITSFTGYLAIFILGLSIGTLILPPSPSHFRRRQKAQKDESTPSFVRDASGSSASSNPTYLHNERISVNLPRQLGKSAIELCAYVVVWWTLFGIVRYFAGGRDSVSRRLANSAYVLWVTAFNSLFLLGYLTVEIAFSPPRNKPAPISTTGPAQYAQIPTSSAPPSPKAHPVSPGPSRSFSSLKLTAMGEKEKRRRPSEEYNGNGGEYASGSVGVLFSGRSSEEEEAGELLLSRPGPVLVYPPLKAPALLEAINLNGLPIFLLANVATGLVNMSMHTMYASNSTSMVVLVGYSVGICVVAWLMRGARIWKI